MKLSDKSKERLRYSIGTSILLGLTALGILVSEIMATFAFLLLLSSFVAFFMESEAPTGKRLKRATIAFLGGLVIGTVILILAPIEDQLWNAFVDWFWP